MDDLTENQVRKLRILDNKLNESEWDIENLKVELADLPDLNIGDLEFNADDFFGDLLNPVKNKYDIPNDEKGSLSDRFGVPPFSVLDTRQGYRQERKKEWLKITGDLSETRDGEFGTLGGGNGSDNLIGSINGGTSNFDPVLAEIVYKWFCPQ